MNRKATLRQQFRMFRANLSVEEREAAGEAIANALLAFAPFQHTLLVAGFASFGDEIPTDCVLEKLRGVGRRVFLPRVEPSGNQMVFCDFTELNGLTMDRFGIRSPDGPEYREAFDLALLPGLCFGKNGGRIGYGGGYYDRYFAANPVPRLRCGLGYDGQIIDEVPIEAHDVPLTHIATPSGVWPCRIDGLG